ncbi:MAG: AMP-binding protein [Actinomycetota bacterium]|nr:AMP-binding protein [Actinomycetota bacterium]
MRGAAVGDVALPAVLCQRFDPELQLGAIERWGGQVTSGVPTMLIGLLAHPRFATTDLSSVEVVISGGSPAPPELVKRVEDGFGARLSNVYGQTELSPVVTQSAPGDSMEDKAYTVGRPLPDVDVKIVDAVDGSVVGIGVGGEICARGYQQMIGYFDDPQATDRTVDGDGWVHTGDLATMDDRGFVRITGRLTDMIIRGGENVYPAEIEHVLFEHPGVAEAVVVGVDDPAWGEQVAAVVRLGQGASPSAEELRSWCRERLASHKTPRFWYRAEELPLTGSGKVQKFVVRARIGDGTLSALP